ncbi:MAG: phage tail sheath family protein [Saprospiraceae bacterium]|nr:phage tail sheath family protein [Saprospiraceae bacterium]
MAKKMKTPGVYILEKNTFPNSIVPVNTSVPAFVGYTQTAIKDGQNVTNTPVRVTSLAEFQAVFGGAPAAGSRFFLYQSMVMYFDNGGIGCYIVSIGTYSATPAASDFFNKSAAGDTRTSKPRGLDALENEMEPTLLVAPDAVLLGAADCFQVQRLMLAQCARLQNRFAILDIHDGFLARTNDTSDVILAFRAAMNAPDQLKWGAAYYPWLQVSPDAGLPSNRLPPSGAIAGIYCYVDQNSGVSKAPANVSVQGATGLTVSINDNQQEDLNVPIDGKAVNALRFFTGKGILVWGARTLDGNSNDWRYISVRRTIIYIEQSIKNALQPYVFMPNTQQTWTSAVSMVSNFLQTFWNQGGLTGGNPQDAFSVQAGLGSTMTPVDIQEGNMIVQVMVATIRPAEFIVLTFKQKMEGV